ncbi:F-box/LRR-repeat protein At3g59250-like [Silene latifolia]|uniref:F-box/LRR-repeat protein At3g59250-like n=1 Tax=Silene latifolia TaxID=37657 RepID=UPI003D77A761
MPDEVIVHILSYLPIVDAVRTMLIRPFGNLWTWVPNLDFDLEEVLAELVPDCYWTTDDVRRSFIFVRNVLMLHKRPFIDKFRLDLYYESSKIRRSELGDEIRMCLKLALDKQARAIYFDEFGNQYFSESSDYPNFIKEFQKFISGCPSLQVLHINSPSDIRNLSFSAPNIRKLFLRFEEDYPDEEPLVLDFPNLKSLDLDLFYGIPDIIHMDVSCVRDVSVSFCQLGDSDNELRRFKLFWEKLSQSEVFRLQLNPDSEDFLHLLDDLHLLQIGWKHVVLSLRIICQRCVLGFYQLIRSSKDLEELDIYTNTTLTSSSVCDAKTEDCYPPWIRKTLGTSASTDRILAQKRHCLGETSNCSKQMSINSRGEARFCYTCVELPEVFTKC